MATAPSLRSECFACPQQAVLLCPRCEGSVCTFHAMPAGRCFACEWFGYYRRWIWLEVLLNVAVLFALVLVLVFRGSWIAYAVGLPLILWLFNARLLSPFDAFKRKLFLAERFAGRWYEYAIPLRRGKLKARAERLSSR